MLRQGLCSELGSVAAARASCASLDEPSRLFDVGAPHRPKTPSRLSPTSRPRPAAPLHLGRFRAPLAAGHARRRHSVTEALARWRPWAASRRGLARGDALRLPAAPAGLRIGPWAARVERHAGGWAPGSMRRARAARGAGPRSRLVCRVGEWCSVLLCLLCEGVPSPRRDREELLLCCSSYAPALRPEPPPSSRMPPKVLATP